MISYYSPDPRQCRSRYGEIVTIAFPFSGTALQGRNRVTSGFRSHLGIVNGHNVAGWVVNVMDIQPGHVMLNVDGVEISGMLSNGLREDVREAGFHPSGYCCFSFDLHGEIQLTPDALVRVIVVEEAVEMSGSPKRI